MAASVNNVGSVSRFQVIIDKNNNFYTEASSRNTCTPFVIDDKTCGIIRPEVVKVFLDYPDVFIQTHDEAGRDVIQVSPNLNTPEHRTEKIGKVLEDLRKRDLFCALRGWRNEKYDVKTCFEAPSLMCVERATAALFGVIHYGVHVNGYYYTDSGQLMMWIGQRSPNKPTYPNMLDNLCAGGLATGLGVRECMVKECQEEASITESLLTNLKQVGTISYCFEDERGIFPECQFVFDLELTPDFLPVNADGEVGGFQVHPIEKIQELIVSNQFKPNCSLVILDFLIRHGIITPETDRDNK